MSNLDDAVREFLALRRIAVVGVSRSGGNPGNVIYTKLRDAGSTVFAVNRLASEIRGDPCYTDLRSIPGGVDGVIITTPPDATVEIVREAAEIGIRHVWIHRAIGKGSLSREAVRLCRDRGIHVIAGACPLMYLRPVDPFHGCFRWILRITGGLPDPGRSELAAAPK